MVLHLIEGITKSDHDLCKKCNENLNYVKKNRAIKRHGIALRVVLFLFLCCHTFRHLDPN